MTDTITFAGAAGTVTGSHHLLEAGDTRILLDCGLFQGEREWRVKNWDPFPVDPRTIDAVVLSHAHIDHSGYLPKLIREGFRGPVYTTAPTKELCALLLPDSARLMEEEAEYRNRKGATRFQPALPLYSEQEAERAVERFRTIDFNQPVGLPGGMTLRFLNAGHILGAGLVSLTLGDRKLLFTGDIGRSHPTMLRPPATVTDADYLICEATYGERTHQEEDPASAIRAAIQAAVNSGGVLVIPAFAVGRAQEVLYLIRRLEQSRAIPELPVVVDSPMASDATEILLRHADELAPDVRQQGIGGLRPKNLRFTRSVEQSKALNQLNGPLIIISSSGMATGGRVLHHLRQRLPDQRNGVLLVGHQGVGTRGRQLRDGADTIRIFREDVPVRARVTSVDALSAHGDINEMMDWLARFQRAPRMVYLVHGEGEARAAMRERIRRDLGWPVTIPSHLQRVTLP